MKKLTLALLALSTCSSMAFADNYLYCPSTGGYANLGASPSQVEQICGKPSNVDVLSSVTAEKGNPYQAEEITQWVYNGHPQILNGKLIRTPNALVISLANNKVRNISLFGGAVNNTTYCKSDTSVSIGDAAINVRSDCGKPDYTQEITTKHPKNTSQTLIYTYNQSYGTAKVLTFKNFKLVSITP